MKQRYLLFIIMLLPCLGITNAQAPAGTYGHYNYAYSFDKNGQSFTNKGAAPYISPMVVTTNFGFIQSTAYFLYPGIGGIGWHNSQEFDWAGYHGGRYVYAGCIFGNCSYLSFASDLSDVWVQYSFNNGNVDVYLKE